MLQLSADHEAQLNAFFADILKPPPKLSVAEWVEKNVRIPPGRESHHGAVLFGEAPHAREPLECYADRAVGEVVLVFGTQCLKTTILRCGAIFRICKDPLPCMWVLPNEKNVALPFSKGRWLPLLTESPCMEKLVPRAKNGAPDKKSFGFIEQTFTNGMPLNFVGSNSPANLSSRPIGLLQMDEIDKYGQETDFEPGALKNAEERAKNFPFPLIVKASTPTTATHGIWPEFLLTDQRYFHVPCPHCEQLIILKFRAKSEKHGDCGLRWWRESEDESKTDGKWDLALVAQNAHYKCQECGGEITEPQRHAMIKSPLARWIPTNPHARAGRRGYHLASFYSLVSKDCTFSAIAAAWCEAGGVMSARHRIINSTLAEPWNTAKGFDDVTIPVSQYTVEELADQPDTALIATIDFQMNHFWLVIRKWQKPTPDFPRGQSWLIVADRISTEGELDAVLEQYKVRPFLTRMDITGRWNAAGQMILRHKTKDNGGWMGLSGDNRKIYRHRTDDGMRIQRIYSETEFRDAYLGTTNQSKGALYPFHYWAKDPVRDLVTSLKTHEPTIWHIHSNAHKAYQRHLNAHVKIYKNNARGEMEGTWHELHSDDHLWDCECMNATVAVQTGYCLAPEEQGTLFG